MLKRANHSLATSTAGAITGESMNGAGFTYATDAYEITFALESGYCTLRAARSGATVLAFAIDSAVDTLAQLDEAQAVELISSAEYDEHAVVVFAIASSVWARKKIRFELWPQEIIMAVEVEGDGQRITDLNYLLNRMGPPGATDLAAIYVPRFDWFQGEVDTATTADDSLSCQQWLSPPPFCYGLLDEEESIFCGIAAYPGEYNFLSFDYTGTRGPSFRLTYEGHTVVEGALTLPKLVIGFGAAEKNAAISRYVQWLRAHGYLSNETDKTIPAWWREPIFCGWGQMRHDYRADHDGHENGNFINVTFYCTEQLYRAYVAAMDAHDVNPGTIIIDMGWAEQPALHKPSPRRWRDLRAFIDEQHAVGRKVLLWYTPVVTDGLPPDACMTLAGRPVCPDPTSPRYQAIVAEEIRRMVAAAPGCLNADGFKIDFTQNTPSESGRFTGYINNFWGLINESNVKYLYPRLGDRTELIQTYGSKWGVEILREYIALIYANMKRHKPDSLLITHTANPYFAEVVDVLRLNDLDGACEDVLGVMQNRAKIARICSRNWLLDTDNDLMVDKARWRAYIELQPQLGIPDTYYISAIAQSQEQFDEADYALLRSVWARYRAGMQEAPG